MATFCTLAGFALNQKAIHTKFQPRTVSRNIKTWKAHNIAE